MTPFPNPLQMAWSNRRLIWVLALREVDSRFRGSFLGILWGFLLPLGTLAIYTFVFTTIFKARWTTPTGATSEFALVVFNGLLFFTLFAEPIARAPGLIGENVSYVKKVVFPIEIMPIVVFISALISFFMGLAIWCAVYVIVLGLPPATLPLAVILLIPMAFLTIGASWFLSSLGVFLRDLRQVIPILTTAILFLSPILYPVSYVPESLRWIIQLNPLTGILEMAKDVMLWGRMPDWPLFLITTILSFLFAWAGYLWFMVTRKAFADVL